MNASKEEKPDPWAEFKAKLIRLEVRTRRRVVCVLPLLLCTPFPGLRLHTDTACCLQQSDDEKFTAQLQTRLSGILFQWRGNGVWNTALAAD